MILFGIAIGIIFTSVFGMALLVIVSRQKQKTDVPEQMAEFWKLSLSQQRQTMDATIRIADALEVKTVTKTNISRETHCQKCGKEIYQGVLCASCWSEST